jgi:isoleucyl-tRNA synthetase
MDYSATVLLPKTDFPMRADLAKREPRWVESWARDKAYESILKSRHGAPDFYLHDGPPFANGDAHVGHALNMVLKDLVLKSRSMMGFHAPFVPGWDCHGLPIEHKVVTEQKLVGADPAVIRTKCEEVARHFIQRQKEQFQRLGVFGDWDHPYLTMSSTYEAAELRVLAQLVEKGMVYEGLRPVHWSTGCRTALAEAEVEYAEREDESAYVRLELKDVPDEDLLVWTTTPWTLPANLAVAVHPGMVYVLADSEDGRKVWLAKSRIEAAGKAAGKELKILKECKGTDLERRIYRHPLVEKEGMVRCAEFVTADSGTGLVHIAPGHGHEDYVLGRKCGLEPFSPVNEAGKLTEECGVPELVGKNVFAANPEVADLLEKKGRLWAREKIRHSYPHCPRSKTPIVFRSVRQWFIRMDTLRDKALEAVGQVKWVPSWGESRIRGALGTRPDWCISRQRSWGLPIPAFYKPDGSSVLDAQVIRKVADRAEKEGTGFWFGGSDGEVAKICGVPEDWKRGRETLDVWLDSGSSWASVGLDGRVKFPADLYLEGSDQHRGWFQSSLLLSVALTGKAPFKAVLTNGFVVDVDGKKMSKSRGKPPALMELVEKYGADVVRLWVASEDAREDVPFSMEIFGRVGDSYRLVRNSIRILLGNLAGFDLKRDAVGLGDREPLDRYILAKLAGLVKTVKEAYESYNFPAVYHGLNRFCSVELSAFYVDACKDRIYCDRENDRKRRSAQTTMAEVLEALVKLVAPVLVFTAEEAWQSRPGSSGSSVHLEKFPEVIWPPNWTKEEEGKWEKLLLVRGKINEALEEQRKLKKIGKSLEARVQVKGGGMGVDEVSLLGEACLVSGVEYVPGGNEVEVAVFPAEGKKCERCWKYEESVGQKEAHSTLCGRCAEVVKGNRS